MSERIPLADLRAHRQKIGPEIDARIAAVNDHGRWIGGPEVREFEAAIEAFVGSPGLHAVACGNGTDALVLAFSALGLSAGQAVICPAFTFVATAEATVIGGGVPVFADVDDDFNLDPDSVRTAHKAAAEEGLHVVGICAVDLFGAPARLDELGRLADELGCWLVSDAAQSFGGEAQGVRVGALAEVTTTSFFPAKPLGCYGDGGMLFAKDEELASVIRSLGSHGKGGHKYENIRIGQNSRLDSIQAAVLLAKLELFEWELDQRQRVADRYTAGLADAVGTPAIRPGDRSTWAQYTITCGGRDQLQSMLADQGIDSVIYYPRPLHRQLAYQQFDLPAIELATTDRLTQQVLSLPMHPYLDDRAIDRVIAAVRDGLG